MDHPSLPSLPPPTSVGWSHMLHVARPCPAAAAALAPALGRAAAAAGSLGDPKVGQRRSSERTKSSPAWDQWFK